MPEAIYNTAVYFKNTYRDSWITNLLSVEMIRDVDKSEVVSASVIESPVLGSITPGRQIDLTWPISYHIANLLRLCVRIDLRGDAVVGRKSSNETTKPSDRDAAIYVRISLDQGTGELALDRQEKECRARAARDGVEVRQERVYSDLSISAADARKRRPAYERLLAGVCAGEVGRVYVWDLDRLTRQPGQLDEWVKLAEAGRCHVVEAHGMDIDLSQSGGLLMARIRVAVAENESKHKGERQRAANRQRARIGRVPVGNRPTGYKHAGEVTEEEAEAVRAVFAAFLAGGRRSRPSPGRSRARGTS